MRAARAFHLTRGLVGCLLISIVAMACGGAPGSGDSGSGTSGSGAPQGQATIGPPVIDAALVSSLVAAGLPDGDATFLAATKVEATAVDGRTARVVEHLASGDTVEFTIRLEAATEGDPGIVEASSTTTDTRIELHLEYIIDTAGMPADVLQALTAAAPRQVAAIGGGPILTAEVSLFNVVVDWAISKVESTLRDKSIQAVLDSVVPGNTGTIMKLIKAGFTVEKGFKLGDALDALLEKLAALEDCANNPTNPLTIKQYQEDPGAKQRVLDQIRDARNDMIANTIVMQLGVLNGFAAGFGPKWLGYAIGPGTAWSKATLTDLNDQRLAEIERAVTKCDCAAGGSSGGSGGGSSGGGSGGGSSGGGTSGGGQSCEFPFILIGTVDHTIRHDGEVVFTSHATQVKWQFDPAQSGPTSSVYNLVAATVEWRYDDDDSEEGCGVTSWHGGGSENGVPDEPSNPGGEAGPGDPDELAFLSVTWTDGAMNRPTPFYWGQAITRLHDKVTYTPCGSDGSPLDPDWMFPGHLPIWFEPGSDPFPVAVDLHFAGTSTRKVGVSIEHIYEWDFAPQP